MEAARAVKMRRQNMREQNKFDDVFATVETKEKKLERCHLLDRKDQHVLVDPQRHTSQLNYVNISVQNIGRCYRLYRQSADHTITQCPGFVHRGSVSVWSSDPGSAHLILKVDHCRLNLICSSLFQL